MQLSVTQMQSTPCHSIGKSMQASKIRRKYMYVFLLGRVPFWQQLVRTKSYELSTRAPVKFCGWGIVIKATKLARWEYTLFFLTLLYAYSKHCIQANHELHKNLYSRNVYFGTVQCTWSDMVVSKVSENLISEKTLKMSHLNFRSENSIIFILKINIARFALAKLYKNTFWVHFASLVKLFIASTKNLNSKIEKLYGVQTDKKGNSENWHLKAFLYYRTGDSWNI